MGCAPTAQRLNSIPSCNVYASSKSTKSTVKNFDDMYSSQKPNFYVKNNQQKPSVKRYYSPEYVPTIKNKSPPKNQFNQKEKNWSKQQTNPNFKDIKENRPIIKSTDIVSHLSLNSHLNSKQNMQFLLYEARKAKRQFPKNGTNQRRQNLQKTATSAKQEKQHQISQKVRKQGNQSQKILENELRNMNAQKFQRIHIERMNF